MKYNLTLLIFAAFISLNGLIAQDTTTTWVNTLDEIRDRQTAPFYRLGWKADGKWQTLVHYRHGPLYQSGQYVDSTCTIKSGEFTTYSKQGLKLSEVHYLAGNFVDDFTIWFDNGNLHTKGQYHKIETGADTVAQAEEVSDDYWNPEEAADIIPSEEHVVKVGRWEYYHSNGRLSEVQEYDDGGNLYHTEYYNVDGNSEDIQATKDHPAQYSGGEAALMKFLGENIKYPKEDRDAGRSGEVLISFMIDRNGLVDDVRIERSVSPTMDAECIRLLSLMPKWMPAQNHNRIEEVRHFLPIRFTNVSPKSLREMKKKYNKD